MRCGKGAPLATGWRLAGVGMARDYSQLAWKPGAGGSSGAGAASAPRAHPPVARAAGRGPADRVRHPLATGPNSFPHPAFRPTSRSARNRAVRPCRARATTRPRCGRDRFRSIDSCSAAHHLAVGLARRNQRPDIGARVDLDVAQQRTAFVQQALDRAGHFVAALDREGRDAEGPRTSWTKSGLSDRSTSL